MPIPAFPLPTVTTVETVRHSQIPRLYSGVVLNQNGGTGTTNGYVSLADSFYFQTFHLPSNYTRGQTSDTKIPPLTGFQVFVGVDLGYAETAALEWRLDHYILTVGWTNIATGVSIGTAGDGNELWFTVYFDQPVEVTSDMLTEQFRLGVKGRDASMTTINEPVSYDGTFVVVEGQQLLVAGNIAPGPLEEGHTYPFKFNNVPSLISVEPGTQAVTYSVQQGVNRLWYSAPNPLALSFDKLYGSNGATAVQSTSQDVSLMFRMLAATADQGVDFLGNQYRSVVVADSASNVSHGTENKFWLSKPNPSRFGVESLYFDVSDGDNPIVVDRIMLDPMTPDVYFHIYYSNDNLIGNDPDSWDSLLWVPVGASYRAVNRQTYALPEPITCKRIKIEFSHLQARFYSPGEPQKPILYKRYPQWVVDFFMSGFIGANLNQFIGRTVDVDFDTFQLYYKPYDGDIVSQPKPPKPPPKRKPRHPPHPKHPNKNKTTDIDFDTLAKIRTTFRPFQTKPGLQGKLDHLLGVFARKLNKSNNTNTDTNYPVEKIPPRPPITDLVSSLERDNLVTEKSYPVMFFFIPSRHGYRLASTTFDHDRAYFAGVKEIAFLRDRYATRFDESQYIEDAGDTINLERNDFETVDFTWVTYNDQSG